MFKWTYGIKMKPVTEKVLQRFGYERLLPLGGLRPRRLRVTLTEIMEAGKEEPRILTALPAVLLHHPKIIHRLDKDLPRYPALKGVGSLSGKSGGTFLGVEINQCIRTAGTYRRYLQAKKETQKSLTMNLRLAPREAEMLRDVSRWLQINNASETIRVLLRQKAIELNVGKF